MKKTKLLMPIIGISTLGMVVAPLTSCSCGGTTPTEEETKLTGIELETISLGEKNYTLTTDYVKVYAVYKKGDETDKVALNCGGLTGYTIKIDGTDVTSTFATTGFKFTQNKEYTVEVSFEGYTKSQKITVSDLAIAVKNSCDTGIKFYKGTTEWSTITTTVLPETEIVFDVTIANSAQKIDPDNSTITCGGEEIQTETGVCYLAGKLIIPATLVTDDIELNLKLMDIDTTVQNQTLEQTTTEIAEACEKYEKSEITIDQFIQSFSVNPSGTKSITLTTSDELIGSKVTLVINGQTHGVRVIGINHDDIWDGTKVSGKAALTFELTNVLSDENGDAMTTQWDLDEKCNYDYTNSKLRANLTGQGTETKTWTNTAFAMLPTELQAKIKTVNKQVATTSSYVVTPYQDTLFILTYTEMALPTAAGAPTNEGSPYAYWTTNQAKETEAERIAGWQRKDINGNEKSYFLASPTTNDRECAWRWNPNFWDSGAYVGLNPQPIAFAFCI